MPSKLPRSSRQTRSKVHVLVAFGTRPEILKLHPVISELRRSSHEFKVTALATAQHREMLDQVLNVFRIRVNHDLNVMTAGQSLAQITTRIITRIDPILARSRPDMVLVQGDTTTTLSVALAAFYRGIPIGHIEAGLRTRNRLDPFPEEINRQVTSVLGTLHFAPTDQARRNLLSESIPPTQIFVTGNTIVDAMHAIASSKQGRTASRSAKQHVGRPSVLVTAHRRESLGEPMRKICLAVARLARESDCDIVFPVHPNPKVRRIVNVTLAGVPNVQLCEPMEYRAFIHAMLGASLIITDSGGIQEEATSLGIPTLVTRATTERPEAIASGIARLVGTDTDLIFSAANTILRNRGSRGRLLKGTRAFGDGHASQRIVQAMRYYAGLRKTRPGDYKP